MGIQVREVREDRRQRADRTDRGEGDGGRPSRLLIALVGAALVALVLTAVGRGWLEERRAVRAARPQLSGRLVLPGLEARAEVVRDGEGLARIRAAGEADAWRALGFVHAQDRVEQMLWLRRLALGTSAEQIGRAGVDSDRWARLLDLPGRGAAWLARLPARERRSLEAYAEGVNARLERLPQSRSRPAPEPWRPEHSLALFGLLSWAQGQAVDVALVLQDLIERLESVGARPFFPGPDGVRGIGLPIASGRLAQEVPLDPDHRAALAGLRPEAHEAVRLAASGLALSGADGVPLLAGELAHPPLVPALLHVARLEGGGLDCVGAAVPGLPLFWAGRCRSLAWLVAPAGLASTDLFRERVHRSDPPRYRRGRSWAPIRLREERIAVRGRDDLVWTVETTHRGPLLRLPERSALSVSWAGALPEGPGPAALMALARAEDVDEAAAGLEGHHDPPVAVLAADREGGRVLQVAGWLPRRVLPSDHVPVPGRMRAFQWDERVPFDRLPRDRRGPGDRALRVSDAPRPEARSEDRIEWLWRPGQRDRGLRAALNGRLGSDGVDLSSLEAAWAGSSTTGDDPEARRALAALFEDGASPGRGAREVLEVLAAWDGEADPDSVGALFDHVFWDRLGWELLAPRTGEALLARYEALPGAGVAQLARAAVLAQGEAGEGSWADPEAVRRASRAALRETWQLARDILGPNQARWRWAGFHRLVFRPLPDTAPGRALAARLGSTGLGGSDATPRRAGPGPRGEARRISGFQLAVDLSRGLGEEGALRLGLVPGHAGQAERLVRERGLERWTSGRLRPFQPEEQLDAEREAARLVLEPAAR